mmetsp:Transcript_78215/g.176754  ORF Transcript_78215/g.176754 Transcript_78215/m.176754 type:complete len:255 (-) Transcript_78215:499-1263(-)
MPSASSRASSFSISSSAMRASSLSLSAWTASSISRFFASICSSKRAWFFINCSSLSLRSLICSSLSAQTLFQSSTVLVSIRTFSFDAFSFFSRLALSLERLLAKMSRPAGPSSRIWNRFSNMLSSLSNSSSLSSGASTSDFLGWNLPLRIASLSLAWSCLFCRLSFEASSLTPRRSLVALFSCACIFCLSRMASSRWTTARPTLSTRSATSLTRFLMDGSAPLAARPRCSIRTSWICALRISFIIWTASWASLP